MEESLTSAEAAQNTSPLCPPPTASVPRKLNVYSRLYDPKSYTGVYKKRFEGECNDLTELVVHDLSDTMRPNLNHNACRTKQRMTSTRNAGSCSSLSSGVAAPPAISSVHNSKPTSLLQEKLCGDSNDPHTLLKAVFHYYCRFGRTGSKGFGEKTLDNSNFVKMCRDCPDLLDESFGKTDVDLIFVKVKKKGERRINYARFLDALGMIAIKKYGDMPLKASVPKLLEAHIAHLHCLLEYTDGKTVQAVWQRRAHYTENVAVEGATLPSPPTVRHLPNTMADVSPTSVSPPA